MIERVGSQPARCQREWENANTPGNGGAESYEFTRVFFHRRRKVAVTEAVAVISIVIPVSEDGAAYAHHGAAFFDRNFIIGGHSHAEYVECGAGSLEFVKKVFECTEFGAHLLIIFGVGGHAHETGDSDVFQLTPIVRS